MRVQEIERQGRVRGRARGKNFDKIVAHTIDRIWPWFAKGVRECCKEGHLRCAAERALIVVVSENRGVWNFSLYE